MVKQRWNPFSSAGARVGTEKQKTKQTVKNSVYNLANLPSELHSELSERKVDGSHVRGVGEVKMKNVQFVTSTRENGAFTPCAKLDDDELVALVMLGNEEAFSTICHKYQRRLFHVAFRIVKNGYDAEDVVQEAFLRAYLRINTFKSASNISTWLTKIVINCSLMELRRQRRRQTLSLLERGCDGIALIDVLPDQTIDIDEAIACEEYTRMLSKGIARLKTPLRVIVETQRRSESSLTEIAEHFGLTVAAIKARLFRARKALKIQLQAKTERHLTSHSHRVGPGPKAL